MGWLHATPEKAKESRAKQLEKSLSQNYLLDLPELDAVEYLIPLWYEAGMVSSSGMGVTGLTWEEIKAWWECFYYTLTTEWVEQEDGLSIPHTYKACTLSSWELLMIKHLSDSYASEYSASSGGPEDRPAPYCTLPENHDRQAVAQKVTSLMQSIMSRQKQPQHTAIIEESN